LWLYKLLRVCAGWQNVLLVNQFGYPQSQSEEPFERDMQMNKQKMVVALALAGLILSGGANAETQFNLSGFGTLAATHSNSRGADYRGSIVQPNGPGISSPWEFGVDTKAGIQAAANMGGGWTATVQAVSDHRYDNSYRPAIEWANIKYQFSPSWYARVGRVVAPVFMVSDYRNIGYAQTAVRQPYDVYELNPITHLDGGDIGTQLELGGGTVNVQLTAGKTKEYVAITTPELKGGDNYAYVAGPAALLNLSYERDASTFRAGFSRYKLSISTNISVFNMYDSGLKTYQSVAPGYDSNLKLEGSKSSLWSLGYSYDPGTWLVQSEFVRTRSDNLLIPDQTAWYVLSGYRLGKFTPYASFSKIEANSKTLNKPDAAMCGAVTGCPLATVILSAVDSGLAVQREQSTIAVGTRYDIYKNMAFKAQFEHVYKPAITGPNRGLFVNELRDMTASPKSTWLTDSRSANLLTLALDFVF